MTEFPEANTPAGDHAMLLESILTSIRTLDEAVRADRPDVVQRLVRDIDWSTLADEFEPVVFGTYKRAVYRYARKAIRNLRRPYIQSQHINMLRTNREMIEWALETSPSLFHTADQQVADAWRREEIFARAVKRNVRAITPITSLQALYAAINAKLAEDAKLCATSAEYRRGERVPRP